MRNGLLLAVAMAFALGGCAGLRQFPETSTDYTAALTTLDRDYASALAELYKPGTSASEARVVRNRLIETRMAVIDAHFKEFQAGLVKETVRAEFMLSLAGIAVGGAGALVAETASQIMSAVSGGLAGAQAAYSKSVFYDKAMSALLAQMQAGRKVVAAQIYQRWGQGIDQYPMWMARSDLEAYYFAGSLPGALISTAADAKVKEAQAEVALRSLTTEAVSQPMIDRRGALNRMIEGLGPKAKELVVQIDALAPSSESFAEAKKILDDQYPATAREADADGKRAIVVLKRAVLHSVRSAAEADRWQGVIAGL